MKRFSVQVLPPFLALDNLSAMSIWQKISSRAPTISINFNESLFIHTFILLLWHLRNFNYVSAQNHVQLFDFPVTVCSSRRILWIKY